jgi:hypothetical protein
MRYTNIRYIQRIQQRFSERLLCKGYTEMAISRLQPSELYPSKTGNLSHEIYLSNDGKKLFKVAFNFGTRAKVYYVIDRNTNINWWLALD